MLFIGLGNHHFFSQAGQKLEAMKALIKSGDTAKIILFANTARNQDIYRLAGNNLQTLNWKEDTSLMDKIVTFYKKANAMDSLASFYESCAQVFGKQTWMSILLIILKVEVDEFKDYEKAKAAYNEALRCLAKASERGSAGSRIDSRRIADRMEQLRTRIEIISEFLEIKKLDYYNI